MSGAIQKLVIKNFRGASSRCEIDFDTKKPLVMLFGENGSGKSTIVDAIDWIANKSLGSLEDRSMGGQRHPYIPTIGKKAKDIIVELTSDGNSWTGVLSGRVPTITGNGKTPKVRILRRAQLLRLIDAKPADRYQELKAFIDVAGVEQSEAALRDTVRRIDNDYNQAVAAFEQSKRMLRELWEKEGSPGDDYAQWAKAKSQANQGQLQAKVNSLVQLCDGLSAVVEKRLAFNNAERSLKDAQNKLGEINKKINGLPAVKGEQTIQLVKLLQEAQGFIGETPDAKSCPVCEQTVDASDLRSSIAHRLQGMTKYRTLADGLAKALKELETAKTVRDNARNEFIQRVRIAAKAIQQDQYAPSEVKDVEWASCQAFLDAASVADDQIEDAVIVADMLARLLVPYQKCRDEVQADLNQLNSIKVQYDSFVKNKERSEALKLLLDRLKKALAIYEKNRKTFTQDILNSVEKEIDQLYRIIHPKEKLGSLKLEIDPNYQNSINQSATFEEYKEVPPQAYFSESHLDTLGFCAWLALAKREQPGQTVIILDDVFTSVDGGHLSRIIQLLTDIARDFAQVIVTTHYRTWLNRYIFAQAPGRAVQLMELLRWSLAQGACVSGTKLAVEELEDTLSQTPLNRQTIANQSGVLLEAVLDRLAAQYQRPLPHNGTGKWTLGALMDSCSKLFKKLKLEKVLRTGDEGYTDSDIEDRPTVLAAMQPFIEEVGQLSFVRNQVGCHFNLDGAEISDTDVEVFGKSTVTLIKALTCLNCGDIPSRRDGSHLR